MGTAQDVLEGRRKHDLYEWLDLILKAVGTTLAIVAAFQAAETYKRDVAEKMLDQRLKFANDALMAAGKVSIAEDWKTYSRALDDFSIIKHGPGIALFGNDETYKAMVT